MFYPAGLLKNMKTGRYHPIVFRPGPAPSSDPSDPVQRFKSKGHHTDGFDTRELAFAYFEDEKVKEAGVWWTGVEWNWSGEGIPAMVEWFSVNPKPQHIGFTVPAEQPAGTTGNQVDAR